jgi:uncharacterized protein YkwD
VARRVHPTLAMAAAIDPHRSSCRRRGPTALDMLERSYVDHVTPGGLDPSDRVALLHRRLVGRVGENLAEHRGAQRRTARGAGRPSGRQDNGSPDKKPRHRENILNPEHTHLAIAAVAKGEKRRPSIGNKGAQKSEP